MTKISSISVILICVYYDFIVTFTNRACDSCVRKLYNGCYCCEIPTIPRTSSTDSRDINYSGHAHSVELRQ